MSDVKRYDYNTASDLFKQYAELTDARRYFTDEEIRSSRREFLYDVTRGHIGQYIDCLEDLYNNLKPVSLYGCYELDMMRNVRAIIDGIKKLQGVM